MFNLSVTPEFLAYLLAGLLALLFDWFPKLSAWFDTLSPLKKQQIIGLLLAVIVAVIFGGICAGLFTSTYACDKAGIAALVQIWLICVGINQGVHALTKPGLDVKLARSNRPANVGQGMVEYALILVLVAVVVIAAVTILGPLVGNVFSTINASL